MSHHHDTEGPGDQAHAPSRPDVDRALRLTEPPHSHPGDDMTVVVEGRMAVQFYLRQGGALVPDGAPLVLSQGQTGYVPAGRIHDAKYLEACKLVYVHDRAFDFKAE